MKRLIVFMALATVMLSSCHMIESNIEDNFLYYHLGEHDTYTCDWIDEIDDIKDIQSSIYEHVAYKLGGDYHYAQSPEETCNLGTGNCADKSILMMSILYTNFGIKTNLVCVDSTKCKSICSGGLDLDHAIVEYGDVYFASTVPCYYVYTDVDVCYRYTFEELFPEAE